MTKMSGTTPSAEDTVDERLGYNFSQSGPVEEDAVRLFAIELYNKRAGSIAAADIDITNIQVQLAKSTGGGAFSTVGITQPVFATSQGRISVNYRFLAAEWEIGDQYRLAVWAYTVDIDGDTIYPPAGEWSNTITEHQNVDDKIDTLLERVGDNITQDSEARVTTDAGVSYFPILRFDIPNGNIDYYDQSKPGGAGWVNLVSGLVATIPYRVTDLIFDLLNSSTGGKDFETLAGAGETILFIMKKEVTNVLQVEGAPKIYTQGAIETNPPADGDSGNPIVDDFTVSDYVEFGITTPDNGLALLEIPFRFHYQRVG